MQIIYWFFCSGGMNYIISWYLSRSLEQMRIWWIKASEELEPQRAEIFFILSNLNFALDEARSVEKADLKPHQTDARLWNSLIFPDPVWSKTKVYHFKVDCQDPSTSRCNRHLKDAKKSFNVQCSNQIICNKHILLFKTLMWNVKLSCKELKGWKTG